MCQAWLAFPGDSACPGPKASQGSAVPTLHPGLGNSHASACPGLVLAPSTGSWVPVAFCWPVSLTPQSPCPRPCGRGQPCSSRPHPGRSQLCTPSLPPGMGAACLPLGTPWPCAPRPSGRPAHGPAPSPGQPGLGSWRLRTHDSPPALYSCLLLSPPAPPLPPPPASSLVFFWVMSWPL